MSEDENFPRMFHAGPLEYVDLCKFSSSWIEVVHALPQAPKISLRLTGPYADGLPKTYEMLPEEDTALQVFRDNGGTAGTYV